MAVEIVEAVPGDTGQTDAGVACDVEPAAQQLTYAEVKAALPVLADQDIKVTLVIQAHKLDEYFEDNDPTAMNEIADVIEEGDPGQVVPWLALSWCDGYFPGSTNYDTFIDAAQKLDEWWRIEEGYTPSDFLIDMELRWSRATKLRAEEDSMQRLALMSSWINPTEFAAATTAYAGLVDDLKAAGWRVVATTAGHLLDDFADNDDDLVQAYGTPLVGIDWDQIDWQLYRTLYQQSLPPGSPQLSNFLVYDYLENTAQDVMADHFPGADLGVDVGLTHAGPVYPDGHTYDDVVLNQGTHAEVRLDVEAAQHGGVSPAHITVYSLTGLVDAGLGNMLDAPRWWVGPPSFDGATGILHTLNHVVDAAL